MWWSQLTDSEKNAMVYLYHLEDRIKEHYKEFIRIDVIDKIIYKFIEIRSIIEDQKYTRDEIADLREIRSSFKAWDGHHYFIFLICRVIDFLLEKL
ncbi:MAG: hypothetical protein ACTSU2_17565 [Promethearchaeota archaeon]